MEVRVAKVARVAPVVKAAKVVREMEVMANHHILELHKLAHDLVLCDSSACLHNQRCTCPSFPLDSSHGNT